MTTVGECLAPKNFIRPHIDKRYASRDLLSNTPMVFHYGLPPTTQLLRFTKANTGKHFLHFKEFPSCWCRQGASISSLELVEGAFSGLGTAAV